MTKSPYNILLNLCFCAFALIMLSACGGGAPDDGRADDDDEVGSRCNADPTLAGCPNNGDDNGGDPPPPIDFVTGYQPSDDETPPAGGWRKALADARTSEYDESDGALDRIGAAHAYARGHTGNSVVVSMLALKNSIDRTFSELTGQLERGYTTAGGGSTSFDAGTCAASACLLDFNTYTATVIVARKNNRGIHGIAYDAKIKPVIIEEGHTLDYFDDAIRQASGADIVVLHANLASFNPSPYRKGGSTYYYASQYRNGYSSFRDVTTISLSSFDTFVSNQKQAWRDAVGTTVVVVPQGDNGRNSVNGMIDLYMDDKLKNLSSSAPVAWEDIDSANRNLGALEARLPLETFGLEGRWLSVIALDEHNRIWEYSNGCGDAKAWCLGAPGVNITFQTDTGAGYAFAHSTTYAAAHVSGAIAVLAEAFPRLTPTELVSLILDTADDLGVAGVDNVYGHGALNLARATEPVGARTMTAFGNQRLEGANIDNSGITLPTSFGSSLEGFTVGFTDDYNRAFIGTPSRITRESVAFTLGDTIATWDSPELQSIALDSNSKMQFTNYDENSDAKDTLIFTHSLPNHTIGFAYNEESKTPDLRLTDAGEDLHFQKIRPIASDLMQLNTTHKLGKNLTVKNAITSGEFDTGNRFNEAMANLNYTGENHQLTIGAGTLQEYGQFLGASGTGAYQLSDATSSTVTHLAITQNLPSNSTIKLKYTNFKTEVDMRYNNFANINDLTADEYQLIFAKKQILGKNDSLNIELIQPFAVTDGKLQQSTVLGYNEAGDYNNVTQNYNLKPTNRRQQLRMTWQNQINLERKTRFFISMQYENHVDNLRDKEDKSILGGISTKF